MPYYGITHDTKEKDLKSHRESKCIKNIHCFDEVSNSEGDWYLYCDACGLIVNITNIESASGESL